MSIDYDSAVGDVWMRQARAAQAAGVRLRSRPAVSAQEAATAMVIARRVRRTVFGGLGGAAQMVPRTGGCDRCGRRGDLRLAATRWMRDGRVDVWICAAGCAAEEER